MYLASFYVASGYLAGLLYAESAAPSSEACVIELESVACVSIAITSEPF